MAEHAAHNRRVLGSSPGGPINPPMFPIHNLDSLIIKYFKLSIIFKLIILKLSQKSIANNTSITTELTFNLYTKTSFFEQGIKFDHYQYSIYIIHQKTNNLNYSIIKQIVSKEISDKTNAIVNRIYLLNQNQLGLAFEKYFQKNNSIYIEFPNIKDLHNFNLYLYYDLNSNFYLKLGIDNFSFNSKNKVEPVIGFYFEY